MSITQIHLFSKNTDAVASLRGYEYQKLKTLESWLQNGADKTDEIIYCEYEEDIFHRNTKSQAAKFRQLKLYSSNFSFSSDEIQKAIIHFFDLYTKGDYLFEDVTFIFEANSKVANSYAENDAQLLKSWFDSQDSMSPELLKECADKAKSIIGNYFDTEYARLAKSGEITPEIDAGYALFKKLTDDDWQNFVKRIKWKFDGLSVDEAITVVNENIKRLILQLPHAIEKEEVSSITGILYQEVSNKSIQDLPGNRLLNNDLLDKLILRHGTADDQWYIDIYEKYSAVEKIEYFSIGEFYEVVDAAQHCRRNKSVWKHIDKWKDLLNQYTLYEDAPMGFKRKALYEIVWLNLNPDYETYKPEGSVNEYDDRLRSYFVEMTDFRSSQELEEALNLINIVNGTSMTGLTSITKDEVKLIVEEYYGILNEELGKAKDDNRKCSLLEFYGFINITTRKGSAAPFEKTIQPLYDILPLLDSANLYNASQLSRRINQMIDLFIRFSYSKNEDVIDGLDKFSESIEPYVQKRDGNYKNGKLNIQKGVSFIKSNRKNGLLKALNYLHKAKDLFLGEETIEGYILATLNISQLYTALGLNFAAKYYALTSLWVSAHKGNKDLLKRIPQSFGLLQHIDFSQGSWLNTIASFSDFIRTKGEFDNTPYDPERDDSIIKIFNEVTFTMHAISVLAPHMQTFLNYVQISWGDLWTETLLPLKEQLEKEIKSEDELKKILEHKMDDLPLNDVGQKRTVQWKALGTLWQVHFDNTPTANAVAEEFCALFQIFLCEISLLEVDFHLLKSKIKITISVGNNFDEPKEAGSNEEPEYIIELPELDTSDNKEINNHNRKIAQTLLYFLTQTSLLKLEELNASYVELFEKQNLVAKSFTVHSFQRMYKDFFNDKLFNSDQRRSFLPVPIDLNVPQDHPALTWRGDASAKYNQEDALKMIKNRYKGAYKVIHLTLDRLKGNVTFKSAINKYRAEGWLDWQITLALMNFIADYKAKLRTEDARDLDPKKIKEYGEACLDVINMDEKDCYIEFDPDVFNTSEFAMQFKHLPSIVMKSWGLESSTRKPNFDAIKELLQKRFFFSMDNVEEGNLLKDI